MTKAQKLTIELLRSAIMGMEMNPEFVSSLTEDDWKTAYSTVIKHGIAALTFPPIEKLTKNTAPPKNILLNWCGQMLIQADSFSVRRKAIDELCSLWEDAGIVVTELKGNSIGKFYEPFFIDEVDHEYCYRLLENNYKVFQFGSILLNHHLGEEKRSFFPKLQHGIIRNYYQIRNMLYIKEKYPKYSEMFDYNKSIKKLIIKRLYCSGLHFCFYLKIILKAFHDYKNNKFGEIEF